MAKDFIQLGFLSGLTGVYGWMAQDQLDGVTIATEEINDGGGVLGKKVALAIRDDKTDPKFAVTCVEELVDKENADLLIGALSANTQIPINDAAKKANKIFISLGQSNDITKAEHLGKYTFHECLTPYMTAQQVGLWIGENIGDRWYLLIADYNWGWSMQESYTALAKRIGANIIGVSKTKFPAEDENAFSDHFSKILKAAPDILIACNYGLDQLKFIAAAGKAKLKREMSIVNTLSEFPVLAKVDPDQSAGMYWAGNFYWGMESSYPQAANFVKRFRDRFSRAPSGYAAYGYSGCRELLLALERTGSPEINSDKIATELEGHRYGHYKTKQWWRPCDHQSMQDVLVFKMKGSEERKDEEDISEVIGYTPWSLVTERSCAELGHKDSQWGHFNQTE